MSTAMVPDIIQQVVTTAVDVDGDGVPDIVIRSPPPYVDGDGTIDVIDEVTAPASTWMATGIDEAEVTEATYVRTTSRTDRAPWLRPPAGLLPHRSGHGRRRHPGGAGVLPDGRLRAVQIGDSVTYLSAAAIGDASTPATCSRRPAGSDLHRLLLVRKMPPPAIPHARERAVPSGTTTCVSRSTPLSAEDGRHHERVRVRRVAHASVSARWGRSVQPLASSPLKMSGTADAGRGSATTTPQPDAARPSTVHQRQPSSTTMASTPTPPAEAARRRLQGRDD